MRKEKFLFLLALLLFAGFFVLFILKVVLNFADAETGKIYKQGLEFYQKTDYQNAYYNFKKISFLSTYSGPALYRQATCAWELKDYKTAAKKYHKFAKVYKNTDVAPESIWKLALSEFELGDRKKAEKYLRKLVEKYPESDFSKAAAYKLGVLYYDSGNKTKAKEYFIEYLEYAPLGRFALDCINLLQNYEDNMLSYSDKLYIANALYENGYYTRSLEILTDVSFEKSWILLTKNYDKLSNIDTLSSVVLKGVGLDFKQSPDAEKEILDIMGLYIRKSNLPSKQAAYNLVLAAKNKSSYPLALFLYSKYVDYDSSIKNYEKIYQAYPNSIVAPDSLWLVFWNDYKNKDYNSALKLSKAYTNVYFDYNVQPKIMFWTAKIHYKMNRKKIARSLLHNIVYNFPNSYYAFRANSILRGSKSAFNTNPKMKIKDKFSLDDFAFESTGKEYRLLNKFVTLGDYDVIQNFKINDATLNSWIAARSGRRAYSVLLARDEIIKNPKNISLSNQKYKFAYPLYYREYVSKYSEKYNINPYLMISLIREESFFNNEAVSSTGAMGLMQLMPGTAKTMDYNLYDTNKLFIPEYNISLGVKYFAYLMEIFNGNEALCVLAYNSGPGSVKKWLSNNTNKDFDEFVENVPYPETANYIKKVYASYWVYTNIYK